MFAICGIPGVLTEFAGEVKLESMSWESNSLALTIIIPDVSRSRDSHLPLIAPQQAQLALVRRDGRLRLVDF